MIHCCAWYRSSRVFTEERYEWREEKQIRKQNYNKVDIQLVDNIDIPFEINFAELHVNKKGNLALKRLKLKERKEEKIKMQKIKKEYEDR